MSTPTYTLINQITLAAAGSEVVFSSIPATYRDLVLVINGLTNGDVNQGGLRFNGDSSTSNYTTVQMMGTTITFSNVRSSDGYVNLTPAASFPPVQSTAIVQIMDYSATNKHKTVLNRMNHGSRNVVQATASRWASTAAINTIEVFLPGGSDSYAIGTSFSLYGIVG